MKKIFALILIAGAIASCGKKNTYSNNFSAVTFINASPGTPTFSVFVDTISQTASALAYKSTSGYLSVAPGARNVEARGTLNNVLTKFVQSPTENFTANTASTIIFYDTLSSGKVRSLRLTDDLTVPAVGNIKVRFVNLAPNSTPLDVTFVRYTGSTPVPMDSVTITNRAYVGASPSAAAIQSASTFINLPISVAAAVGAGGYIIRLKTAGTGNVLSSTTLSTTSLTSGQNLTGILTFIAMGTAQGQPLSLSAYRNYP